MNNFKKLKRNHRTHVMCDNGLSHYRCNNVNQFGCFISVWQNDMKNDKFFLQAKKNGTVSVPCLIVSWLFLFFPSVGFSASVIWINVSYWFYALKETEWKITETEMTEEKNTNKLGWIL